jgi:hypothetical protein
MQRDGVERKILPSNSSIFFNKYTLLHTVNVKNTPYKSIVKNGMAENGKSGMCHPAKWGWQEARTTTWRGGRR